MNLGHPALKDMINMGCRSQVKIFLAFQTYMELCEVHKAEEVSYKYCPELDIIYLLACTNEVEEIYVPLSQSDTLSPKIIQSYQKYISKENQGKVIHIAIRDVDTSCVMYKVTEGLERPLSPDTSKQKKDLKEKRNLIKNEIYNLLPTLIKEAKAKNE